MLPGGPTDKIGNRYEGSWTVGRMAEVMDEDAVSIRLEPPGPEGEGVEFWLRRTNTSQYEQVKIQHGAEGRWSLGELNARGVLAAFAAKLEDPEARCVFVSSDSAPALEELSQRARGAASFEEFEQHFLTSRYAQEFDRLRGFWGNAVAENAYRNLKRVDVETISERSLRNLVRSRLAPLVDADPDQVQAILAQFALDNVYQELTALDIWGHLDRLGIRRRRWGNDPHVLGAIRQLNDRFVAGADRAAILSRTIPRTETDIALHVLADNDGTRRLLVTGDAGSGKSGVVAAIAGRLQAAGTPVLAFRLDSVELAHTPEALVRQREM